MVFCDRQLTKYPNKTCDFPSFAEVIASELSVRESEPACLFNRPVRPVSGNMYRIPRTHSNTLTFTHVLKLVCSCLLLYRTPSIPNLCMYRTSLPGDGTPFIRSLWIYWTIFQGMDGFGIARDNCTFKRCGDCSYTNDPKCLWQRTFQMFLLILLGRQPFEAPLFFSVVCLSICCSTLCNAVLFTVLWCWMRTVLLFSILNKSLSGYINPVNIMFHNECKWISEWHNGWFS